MTSQPVVPPVQPEFHPEFGYLWAAAHTRRMMRIGLFATAFGAMAGAIAAIAMTHRGDADAVRAQAALAVQAPRTVEAAPAAAAAVMAASPTVAADPAVGTRKTPSATVETSPKAIAAAPPPAASASAGATSCKEQTWPYLDSKCIKNTGRKREQVRVLKPETPPQSTPAEPGSAAYPATSSETTAAAKPPESPKISKKREKKIPKSRERRRDREFAESDRERGEDRSRYVEPRRYEPRNAYASPYDPRYEIRGAWGW